MPTSRINRLGQVKVVSLHHYYAYNRIPYQKKEKKRKTACTGEYARLYMDTTLIELGKNPKNQKKNKEQVPD